MVNLYVGITDYDWFCFLSTLRGVEEVNFWQPGGRSNFKALRPGELPKRPCPSATPHTFSLTRRAASTALQTGCYCEPTSTGYSISATLPLAMKGILKSVTA